MPDRSLPLNGDPRATAIGFVAIIIWGLAALTVHLTRDLPTFQILAIGFLLGGAALTLWGRWLAGGFAFVRQSPRYYAIVITLVFINNAGFVLGLRYAPIVTASLINYLWPLLIVLLSVPILRRPLRWWHALGVAMGFAGCLWLVTGEMGIHLSAEYIVGYLAALTAAISWAIYSLVLRRDFARVPTYALGPVFFGVAALCLLTWPIGQIFPGSFNAAWQWPALKDLLPLTLIGFGTFGLAYACWDYGARRGDVRVMGAGSYLTPLLSTLALAILGDIPVTTTAWLACGLIIGGAFVGSGREIFALKNHNN